MDMIGISVRPEADGNYSIEGLTNQKGILVINAPVRIIAGGNIPSVNKLEKIGVACLSFPAKLYEGKLRQLAKMSKELEQIDSIPFQNHN